MANDTESYILSGGHKRSGRTSVQEAWGGRRSLVFPVLGPHFHIYAVAPNCLLTRRVSPSLTLHSRQTFNFQGDLLRPWLSSQLVVSEHPYIRTSASLTGTLRLRLGRLGSFVSYICILPVRAKWLSLLFLLFAVVVTAAITVIATALAFLQPASSPAPTTAHILLLFSPLPRVLYASDFLSENERRCWDVRRLWLICANELTSITLSVGRWNANDCFGAGWLNVCHTTRSPLASEASPRTPPHPNTHVSVSVCVT